MAIPRHGNYNNQYGDRLRFPVPEAICGRWIVRKRGYIRLCVHREVLELPEPPRTWDEIVEDILDFFDDAVIRPRTIIKVVPPTD